MRSFFRLCHVFAVCLVAIGCAGPSDLFVSKTPGSVYSDWMADSAEFIRDKKLNELVLPGTHDSGSYAITPSSVIAPDIDPIFKRLSGITFGAINHTIAAWSRTQGMSIAAQLEAGIRYFDLRVCRRKDGDFYMVHGMYSDSLDSAISDIRSFLIEHDREILVLDFNHFYEMTDEAHVELTDKIISELGFCMCPSSKTAGATVDELWEADERVIVIYHDDVSVGRRKELWGRNSIRSRWPNKQDTVELKKVLDDEVENRGPMEGFWVLQGVVTPDASMVKRGMVPLSSAPESLKTVAEEVTPRVVEWLKADWRDKDLNIICVDWFDLAPIVDVAVQMNRSDR